MSIHIIQSDKWPFHVTLVNTDKTLNLSIQLAEFGSKDTLQEANARPANITLLAHLKLFAAAPEMLELLHDVRQYVADANLRSDGYAEIDLKAIDALLATMEESNEIQN